MMKQLFSLIYFRLVKQFLLMGADQIKIKYANKLEYNGSIKDNKPNGQGRLAFKNGSTFEGQFLEGQPKRGKIRSGEYVYEGELSKLEITGEGVLIDKSNTTYKGTFQSGKLKCGQLHKKNKENQTIFTFKGSIQSLSPFNAQGKLVVQLEQNQSNTVLKQKRILQGNFKNGNLVGEGEYILANGGVYKGQFDKGKLQGKGSYQCQDYKVSGDFKDNQPHGTDQIFFQNGDKYQGSMKDGQMHGSGKYIYRDGTLYEGDFYMGAMWGQCKITYPQNQQIQKYQGQINEGAYNGIGALYFANGVIYKGYFLQGAKNGYGVIIYGKQKYKCLYLMNQLSGQLKLISN